MYLQVQDDCAGKNISKFGDNKLSMGSKTKNYMAEAPVACSQECAESGLMQMWGMGYPEPNAHGKFPRVRGKGPSNAP